jgi:hypothetical protein
MSHSAKVIEFHSARDGSSKKFVRNNMGAFGVRSFIDSTPNFDSGVAVLRDVFRPEPATAYRVTMTAIKEPSFDRHRFRPWQHSRKV